ncbi:MAG: helix-turn-helix domain-containing protein [Bryobacteraceae bacterium]|nr:helix-turn-helix domain-containing protein [Bryobacteraceae bacterium]
MGSVAKVDRCDDYGALLARYRPRVIHTKREYERLVQLLEDLDFAERELTKDEQIFSELLTRLLLDYEDRTVKIKHPTPAGMLKFLMEQHGLRQMDLVGLVGSRALVSQLVNGKRGISKDIAKKLAARFGVSAEVFL